MLRLGLSLCGCALIEIKKGKNHNLLFHIDRSKAERKYLQSRLEVNRVLEYQSYKEKCYCDNTSLYHAETWALSVRLRLNRDEKR